MNGRVGLVLSMGMDRKSWWRSSFSQSTRPQINLLQPTNHPSHKQTHIHTHPRCLPKVGDAARNGPLEPLQGRLVAPRLVVEPRHLLFLCLWGVGLDVCGCGWVLSIKTGEGAPTTTSSRHNTHGFDRSTQHPTQTKNASPFLPQVHTHAGSSAPWPPKARAPPAAPHSHYCQCHPQPRRAPTMTIHPRLSHPPRPRRRCRRRCRPPVAGPRRSPGTWLAVACV